MKSNKIQLTETKKSYAIPTDKSIYTPVSTMIKEVLKVRARRDFDNIYKYIIIHSEYPFMYLKINRPLYIEPIVFRMFNKHMQDLRTREEILPGGK